MKKRLITVILSTALVSGFAIAADQENNLTTDTSRNPITGTTTTTTKHNVKHKRADGTSFEKSSKHTTSVKKDGTVEEKVQTDRKDPAPKAE